MENTSERVLRAIVYYSLIAVVVALTALFVSRVATTDGIALWIQIIYYIWSAAVIFVVACDLTCIIVGRTRCYLGYVLYGITIAAIVMADILFMNLNLLNALGTSVEVTFMGLMGLCFVPTILAILVYFTGRRMLNQR